MVIYWWKWLIFHSKWLKYRQALIFFGLKMFRLRRKWRTIEKVRNSPSWMGGEKILEELKVNIPKVDCAPNRLTRNFEKNGIIISHAIPKLRLPCFQVWYPKQVSPWFSSLNFSGIQAAWATGKTCAFLLPIISSLDTAQARSSFHEPNNCHVQVWNIVQLTL